MAGTRNVNHVQIVLLDQTVEMHIDEVQTRRRAPMAEQSRFDVFKFQRLTQQRIVVQVNLPDRKIICRPPIGIHHPHFFGR